MFISIGFLGLPFPITTNTGGSALVFFILLQLKGVDVQ
jgi:hypothetical protein